MWFFMNELPLCVVKGKGARYLARTLSKLTRQIGRQAWIVLIPAIKTVLGYTRPNSSIMIKNKKYKCRKHLSWFSRCNSHVSDIEYKDTANIQQKLHLALRYIFTKWTISQERRTKGRTFLKKTTEKDGMLGFRPFLNVVLIHDINTFASFPRRYL